MQLAEATMHLWLSSPSCFWILITSWTMPDLLMIPVCLHLEHWNGLLMYKEGASWSYLQGPTLPICICALQSSMLGRSTSSGGPWPERHLASLNHGQGLFHPQSSPMELAPTWDQSPAGLVTVLQGMQNGTLLPGLWLRWLASKPHLSHPCCQHSLRQLLHYSEITPINGFHQSIDHGHYILQSAELKKKHYIVFNLILTVYTCYFIDSLH